MLREEGLIANRMGIHKFLHKRRETNNIERRPSSGRPTKMMVAGIALVEQQMRDDDETTAVQLHALLLPNLPWSFIQRQIILRLFYSATNHSRTVHPFRLSREGVLYNEKGVSVFVLFCDNNIILSHTVTCKCIVSTLYWGNYLNSISTPFFYSIAHIPNYGMWQYNTIISFRFIFVYTETLNRLNGLSGIFAC